jgi:hypothetical protein
VRTLRLTTLEGAQISFGPLSVTGFRAKGVKKRQANQRHLLDMGPEGRLTRAPCHRDRGNGGVVAAWRCGMARIEELGPSPKGRP